jgi:hypothetical protein
VERHQSRRQHRIRHRAESSAWLLNRVLDPNKFQPSSSLILMIIYPPVTITSDPMSKAVTMADSGIPWIDTVFDWCVLLLVDIAKLLGISYEELNIWLFVVMAPTAMAVSVMMNIVLAWKIRGYRKRA